MARRRITITSSGGRRTVRRGRSRSPKAATYRSFWSFFRKWVYGRSGSGNRRHTRH